MKICKTCNSSIPSIIVINGIRHNSSRRTQCLNCSPFKKKNRKPKCGPEVIRNLSKLEFSNIIQSSINRCDVFKKLNVTLSGSTFDILNKRISDENVNISHFKTYGENGRPKYDLETILVKESPYNNSDYLKKRLVNEKVLKYECSKCKLTELWMDEPITLHLHHINGNRKDNRLENLRLLCPNCHSQTYTFCGKNIND